VGKLIYLDHAATTPLRPDAQQAMEPFLGADFGNPSSIYRLAQHSRSAIDAARDTVASCLGGGSDEIVFTSGATEGNNAAIKGTAFALSGRGRHIVTTAIESLDLQYPEVTPEKKKLIAEAVPLHLEGLREDGLPIPDPATECEYVEV